MKQTEEYLRLKAVEAIKDLFQADVNASDIQVQQTRKEFEGDITIVVFPFTRFSKKSPEETAKMIGEYLEQHIAELAGFSVVKGFLNLSYKDSHWIKTLEELSESWDTTDNVQKVMVEYSSPNTNKPLHLGHVRNNLLGYSIAQMLKARGHTVTMTSLINDRGIHICKSMLAWIKFGNGETPDSSGMKGDHLVGKYYVIFDREYKKQIADLIAGGMEKVQAEKEAPLMQEAREMLLKWEEGDHEVIDLWKRMNGWVYKGFDETYRKLGVHFDKLYYESQTYLLGKDIVEKGLNSGVFYKKADGSIWIDLTAEGLDEKVVLRADGTSLYITQDLGTAQERFRQYNLDKLIYIVGNEQEYHFKVLHLILKKLKLAWADSIHHLSYGMVELPEGKMKSREGTVVDADDLIDEMISEAESTTKELGKIAEMTTEEQKELYRKIGMAALKFFILRTDPKKQMLFNPAESIELQGFTGPFIQYTYARIKSILRKNEEDFKSMDTSLALEGAEKEILMLIARKDNILEEAERELSPAVLANYAFEIAKTYNRFYHDHSVLNEPDEAKRNFRLKLSEKTALVLAGTLGLLGIEVVERM